MIRAVRAHPVASWWAAAGGALTLAAWTLERLWPA